MDIKALAGAPVVRPAVPALTSTPAASSARSADTDSESTRTGGGGVATGSTTGAQTTAPGIFISPVLRYDQSAALAVLYFRDSDTGETKDQIPAERVVEQYRRAGRHTQGSDDAGSGQAAPGNGTAPASGNAAGTGSGTGAGSGTAAAGGGTDGGGTGGGTGGVGGEATPAGAPAPGVVASAYTAPVATSAGPPSGGGGGERLSVTV